MAIKLQSMAIGTASLLSFPHGGWLWLMFAASEGVPEIVQDLLEFKADPALRDQGRIRVT